MHSKWLQASGTRKEDQGLQELQNLQQMAFFDGMKFHGLGDNIILHIFYDYDI